MHYSEDDSGLIVAEHGSDGAAVARALRDYDPDLRLIPQVSDGGNRLMWKVFQYRGNDRPATPILSWRDRQGNPLPLSMRILDKVKELDPNTRSALPDVDAMNAREQARRQKDFDEAAEAIRDEWLPRAQKGRIWTFQKSPALAVARRRGRRKGTSS